MSTKNVTNPPSNAFDGATPIFCVASVPASVQYYVNSLGFKVDWEDPGRFASVSRGRCCIFLCKEGQGHPGAWTWVGVSDADALAVELRAKGIKIRNPPTNYPWAYELQVEDPDGNVLRFGSDSKKDEPFSPFLDMNGRSWPISELLTRFPLAVPEIPVSNVDNAAGYYVNVLGFRLDWGNDEGGIGGISQGECRMFLTNAPFRQNYGNGGTVVVWLNLKSKHEVDELYHRWRQAGAKILAEPEDKPWRLREFSVADLDGNQLRVFYDFSSEHV